MLWESKSTYNDGNRPCLTSGAAPVAEDCQEVSKQNTIGEMAEAITRGNDIGLWPVNTPEKCGNIGRKTKQVLFDIAMKSYF